MADVRLRHGWLWVVLLALLLTGAGLLTSSNPHHVGLGIALLLTPLLGTGILLVVFYVQSRRQQS